MIRMRIFAMAASVALAGVMALPASAQWRPDNGGYYHNDSKAYQQGYREGQQDRTYGNQRAHNHAWANNNDAQAYAAGYRDGYSSAQANGRWGGYPAGAYNSGYYGQYPNGAYGGRGYGDIRRQAEQIGYQDGLNDGRSDRNTGHSFRPTHDDNYKHADRGYSSAMGNKQEYKDTYRQGYERGYNEGYNRGGRRW